MKYIYSILLFVKYNVNFSIKVSRTTYYNVDGMSTDYSHL